MRNLFTEPVMNISLFDVENVITTSDAGNTVTGTPVVNQTAIENYTKATANWQETGDVLHFN